MCREQAIWYTFLKTPCFEKRENHERNEDLSNTSCGHGRYPWESLGPGSGLARYRSERYSTDPKSGVWLRNTREIEASISAIVQPVILCGHSHVPRTVALPQGKLIINPGSVGLPAYTMETPIPYAMESGSPHARYALLRRMQNGWQVEHIQVPYPSEQAAAAARSNQRPDWAQWLAAGRAR